LSDCIKRDNESKYDFIKRIVYGKMVDKTLDIDYELLSEPIFGEGNCYNSSEVRKRMYGIKYLIDIIDQQNIDSIQDDDVLKSYELKKQELQKEKIKIQTEKLNLSQMLREEARYELFTERAIEAINNSNPLLIPEIHIENNKYPNREGVLIFADPHYGKDLEIKGLRGEILNKYSPEIFEKRMWQLLEETVVICNKEDFTSIKILSLGDELEGMLRIGQLMNLRYGVVESAIKYSYFIASWLNELSKYIKIDFYSTYGNHTDLRLLDNKKGTFPHENISKIIDVLVSEILKDNQNITFNQNETDKIYVNIQGFNILGVHGEEKDIAQSIRDYGFIYNENIDYIISGHKHHANSSNLGRLKGSIGAGSIIGIDDYSMMLKRVSDPSATFVVFEKGKGKKIEYQIVLD